MSIIRSGDALNQALVGSTSKAIRYSPYAKRGNYTGQQRTMGISTLTKVNTANSAAAFCSLFGFATTPIKVNKIRVCATIATTATYMDLAVIKRTATVASGGTSQNMSVVVYDSNNAPNTFINGRVYTAAPTSGTGGGAVASATAYSSITGTPANGFFMFDFDFTGTECEPLFIEGTQQSIELAWVTLPGAAPTVTVFMEVMQEV